MIIWIWKLDGDHTYIFPLKSRKYSDLTHLASEISNSHTLEFLKTCIPPNSKSPTLSTCSSHSSFKPLLRWSSLVPGPRMPRSPPITPLPAFVFVAMILLSARPAGSLHRLLQKARRRYVPTLPAPWIDTNCREGLLDLLQRVICQNATEGKMRITRIEYAYGWNLDYHL